VLAKFFCWWIRRPIHLSIFQLSQISVTQFALKSEDDARRYLTLRLLVSIAHVIVRMADDWLLRGCAERELEMNVSHVFQGVTSTFHVQDLLCHCSTVNLTVFYRSHVFSTDNILLFKSECHYSSLIWIIEPFTC